MKKLIVLAGLLVFATSAFAAQKQILICTLNMTDDNGFSDGQQSLAIEITGNKATVEGLTGNDRVRGFEKTKDGKYMVILGYNNTYQFNIWIPVKGIGKAGRVSGVAMTLFTGMGNYDGKGSCKSELK